MSELRYVWLDILFLIRAVLNFLFLLLVWSLFENSSSDSFAYFTLKKIFLNALAGTTNSTNAQKYIYSKNFVKGEALNTIKSIAVDDEGFKTAFDMLDFNFPNKEEIKD